jgi:hypothetical protein
MEQQKDFTARQQSSGQQSSGQHWEVTYLDTDCGRVRTESFDDALSAERFACRHAHDENGWAMVDVVRLREGRAAA